MTSDDQYLSGLGLTPTTQSPTNNGKIYMAAVSAWFYTHYGPDSYNKNVGVPIFENNRRGSRFFITLVGLCL